MALLPLSRLPVTKQPSCRSGHLAAAASNGSRLAACQRWTPLARRGRSGEWAPGGAEGWGGLPSAKCRLKFLYLRRSSPPSSIGVRKTGGHVRSGGRMPLIRCANYRKNIRRCCLSNNFSFFRLINFLLACCQQPVERMSILGRCIGPAT